MKDSLFFFTEKDGRTRQVQNGVVTSLGNKKPLPQAPIGSHDIAILWERSLQWFGNIRNFSFPLGFVMQALQILRNDSYKFNVDRELYLLILRYVTEVDAVYYRSYYKFLYKGRLDFKTFNDKQGESIAEISIEETGVGRLLKSQGGTQFYIPFDEDAVNIKMDGVLISEKRNFITLATLYAGDSLLGVIQTTREGEAPGVATFTIYNQNEPGDLTTSLEYFLITSQAITSMRLYGSVATSGATPNPFELRLKSSAGQDILIGDIVEAGILSFDININGGVNEKFFLVLNSTGLSSASITETDIHLEFTSKVETTYIKAFKPYDFYVKLCAKMGIAATDAISTLLQNCNIMLTSGDAIRGLPDAGIKTTFNSFFKSYNVYLMAGLAVENDKLVFESRHHFFVPDSISPAIPLGEAKDMNITVADDLIGSSIKVGHQEQDVDDVNGKYDPNGVMIFSTPNKAVDRQIDLQSDYKAGPYEMERLRANYEGKTSTDSSKDNSVYVIATKADSDNNTFQTSAVFFTDGTPLTPGQPLISIVTQTPQLSAGMTIRITASTLNNFDFTIASATPWLFGQLIVTNEPIVSEPDVIITIQIIKGQNYNLDRSITVTAGVPDLVGIFNIPLTPKRILAKHYPWLGIGLHNYDSDKLKFESANRNKDLVAGGITESADVNVNEMGVRIAKPWYLEFGTQVPISLCETLETEPNKCFSTIWNEKPYTGFLWKGGLAPNSLADQKYVLLLGEENDAKDLIL